MPVYPHVVLAPRLHLEQGDPKVCRKISYPIFLKRMISFFAGGVHRRTPLNEIDYAVMSADPQ